MALNFENVPVTPFAAGRRNDSVAPLTDGRIVYMYTNGSTIEQAIFNSVPEMLASNGSVSNAVVSTVHSGVEAAAATVFRTEEGNLYHIVAWRNQNGDNTARVRLYYSPSGNANDWVLQQNIRAMGGSSASSAGMAASYVGIPFRIPDTDIMLCTATQHQYSSMFGAFWNYPAIYRSTDAGATWSLVVGFGVGAFFGGYVEFGSRNIWYNQETGRIYWSYGGSYSGAEHYVRYSDDNGASFPSAGPNIVSFWYGMPSNTANSLYRVSTGGNNWSIYTAEPFGAGGFTYELVKSINMPSNVYFPYGGACQQAVNKDILTYNYGYMLRAGTVINQKRREYSWVATSMSLTYDGGLSSSINVLRK